MVELTKDYDALGGGRRERCLPSLEARLGPWGLGAACILAAALGGPSETPGCARRAAMVVGRR